MVRSIPSNTLALLNNGMGIEPVAIVRIYWNYPTYTEYSDREVTGQNVKPAILSMGNIDDIINIDGGSSSVSLSVVLDDYDDTLRDLLNTNKIFKAPVEIYQHFNGLNYSDKVLVFKGIVTTPVEWSEGERKLSIQIESQIKSTTVAYSPEEGQYAYIQPELIGETWPLCFGSPIHVPVPLGNTTRTGATASYFSIPDPVLNIKKKLIQFCKNRLLKNREYVLDLITQTKYLVDDAKSLQDEYAQAILDEDYYKQTGEDLAEVITNMNTQVQEAIETYEGENTTSNFDILAKMRDTRDLKLMELKENNRLLDLAKKTKMRIEHDIKTLKYAYSVEGKCRKKLATIENDYDKLLEQEKILNQIFMTQTTAITDGVVVSNGEYFPQNVDIPVLIRNQLLRGKFNGRKFFFSSLEPTYTNIVCGPKMDTDMNTFYITDKTLKLNGTFARLQDGTIISITEQTGLKCSFELKRVQDKRTLNNSYGDTDNKYMKSAKEGLSRLLTGNETDEEIVEIIASIPKDISIHILKQLVKGPANRQILRLDYTPGGGTFKLIVDKEETASIPFNASAATIRAALLDLAWIRSRLTKASDLTVEPSLSSKSDNVSVNPMFITFDNRCLPMPNITADGKDLIGLKNKVRFGITNYDGTSDMECVLKMPNGDLTQKIVPGMTASAIEKILVNTSYFKAGEVKVYGTYIGARGTSYVIIEWLKPLKGRIKIQNAVNKNGGEFVITGFVTGVEPCATVYTYSEGAHEYTLKEITDKINKAIKDTEYEKPIADLKKKINELMAFDKNEITPDDWDSLQEVYKYLRQYKALLSNLQLPNSVVAEAYRAISDAEYSHLFDLEILNWMTWRRSMQPISETIEEPAEKYYVTGDQIKVLSEVAGTVLPRWVVKFDTYEDEDTFIDEANKLPETESINFDIGETLKLDLNYQEKYVCNLLPSTIHAVYAYRSVNGLKSLVPVPSSYYTKNENEPYGPYNLTTVTLIRPLSDYEGEYWEDGLFVTLTSSIGPNICDIITWILNKYTNITQADFSTLKPKLTNYPAHFAITDRQDALELCKSIAWQSRCSLWVKNGVAHMTYLSEDPVSVSTFTESDINFNSLVLSTSNGMDVVTKFVAVWQPHYAVTKPNKQIFRGNIPRYNEVSEEYSFSIYNTYDLVAKSATFWFIRKANIFKVINFTTAVHKLNVEVFDYVTISLQNNLICDGDIIGQVIKADYDSESGMIQFQVWLPIVIGEKTKFKFAFPSSTTATDIFPSPELIAGGNAGNPINQLAPSGTPVNPIDNDLLYIRPNDYGKRILSDSADSYPSNPANEYTEIESAPVDGDNVELASISDTADGSNDTDFSEIVNHSISGFASKPETFIGHVDSFEKIQENYAIYDSPTGYSQFYKVRAQDGELYTVRQMQIHKDDRIPKETVVTVVYNQVANEYQMQVPVYIGEYDIG